MLCVLLFFVGVRVACFLFVGGGGFVLSDILVFCFVCFVFVSGGLCCLSF